jgi:hypothetical protein
MPKAKSAVVQITPEPITIPKHKPWGWIISIVLLLIILGAGFWFWKSKQTVNVSNFDECKAANGQIQETFPERCIYKDKSYLNETQQLVEDSTLSGEKEAPYATYSNEKLGFALVIPEAWKNYTVTESLDAKTGLSRRTYQEFLSSMRHSMKLFLATSLELTGEISMSCSLGINLKTRSEGLV